MEIKIAEYTLLVIIIATLFAIFGLILVYIGYLKFREADKIVEKLLSKKLENLKTELEYTVNDIINAQAKLDAAYRALSDKNIDVAISLLKQAEEIYPKLLNLHNTLGYAYMEKQLFYPTIDEFKKAIELRPDHVAGYNDLSKFYALHNRFDLSYKYLKRAVEIDPDSVNVEVDPAYKEMLQDRTYARKIEKLFFARR